MKKWWLILLLFSPFSLYYSQNIYPDNINDDNIIYTSDALNRLYIIGLQYLNEGELTQAEIAFRSILAFPYRSKDWRTTRYYKGKAYFYLGDIYFIQKRYDKAIDHYKTTVQDHGEIEEYSKSLYKLGRSLILFGQQKDGIAVLKDYNYNYSTRDGLIDNSLFWIAQGYIGLEDNITALKVLHQILRDFPNSSISYDVRTLINSLEDTPPLAQQQKLGNNNKLALSNTYSMDQIRQEKDLVDRMKQLLLLKEQLLHIKERKLGMLESLGQTRVKALGKREISNMN